MKTIFRLSFVFLALTTLTLFAEKPVNTTIFGYAIKGYDPIAYFKEGKPVKGIDQFNFDWNGATWLFANAENLAAFKAAPEKYAPQYGGYCAWAVSRGYTAGIDPEAWKIVNDKLYLNYSPEVQKMWSADIPGNITKGDTNWPKIVKK